MSTEPMVTVDQLSPEFMKDLLRKKQNADLGAWAENAFKQCKNLRIDVERQWYANLAMYFGKQYLQPLVVRGTNQITFNTPAAPPWRVRMVVNRVRPIIRTEVAKLTAQRPTAYVIPASGEEQDKMASKAAEQIWTAAYRDLSIHAALRRSIWWGVICGNSFIKEYWDQSAGPSIPNPQDPKGPPIPQGDVVVELVNPFYLFVPDILCEDIEEEPYLIHSTVKPLSYVKRTYGVDANPSRNSQQALIDLHFLNVIGEANVDAKESCLVHEVWIKPNGHKLFPNGGMITVVDSQVVQRIDNYPYPHGEYPFSKFDHVQSGKFYSDSVITDLIPLQKELNRTRSQVIENKNLMSKPQLLAAKGSVNPRKITSEPGQVVEYNPGMPPPQPLPLQGLPSYVLQEIDRLTQDMDDVSGQHEISRGQNPSQVTAASALTYLQEQDESKLASSVASVEEFVEKIARLYLKYVVYYWDLPRTVRVVGRDKLVDAAAWKGSDIKGNTDIRVEAGSAIPQGKMQKRAFLLDLFKLGALDPSMLFELLEMNDLNDANAEFLVDKQQAMRENMLMMENGPQLPPEALQPSTDPATGEEIGPQIPQMFLPNSFDNHEAHIMYHNSYRKSQEFATADDVVKQLFEYHVTMHMMAFQSGVAPTATSPDGQPGEPMQNPGESPAPVEGEEEQGPPPGGNTSAPSNTQPPGQGN